MIDRDFTVDSIRELSRYPSLLDQITSAAKDRATITLDLADLAWSDPFALAELVLLARSMGVVIVSSAKK